MSTTTARIKLSARIPQDLFLQLEDRRHELSRSGKRVSARELVELAIQQFLKEVRP